jgi:aspartate kinase
LDARRVEIWTDVDGLMTADPRIVPSARTLAAASYEEAAELATFGAKILHPATALPLVRAGIPIVILNSRHPEGSGTTVGPAAVIEPVGDSPIRSISWKQGITVVNIRAPRMLGAYGFLRALFEIFERHETAVDVLASGEVSVSLTIEDRSETSFSQPRHVRHVVVASAPALFSIVCSDANCRDGGHDVTDSIMRALVRRETAFAGDDRCYGALGSSSCTRVLHYEAVASYRDRAPRAPGT